MRFTLSALVLVSIALAMTRPVRAEKLALGDVHGEVDVADEAGAVTLLVRSALVGPDRTLLGAPPGFRVADPAALAKVGADHAVAMELSREGTGLRITIVIVGTEPNEDPDVSFVRAGDGDLQALAKGVSERITSKLKLEPGKVPGGSLGQLRPFARAIRSKPTDPSAAALALSDVITRTTPAAAQTALQGLPELATPPLAVIAARAIGDVAKLDAIGTGTDGTAAAARAFAAIHRVELAAADQALVKAPAKDGLVALARVIVAEARADDRGLGDRIKEGLSTDQHRAILAFVSTITPKRIDPALHRALVALAEQAAETSPGVAARIGLAAAEQGVEVTRSLGLVRVRELDDADLERLTPFLAKDDASPTILRIKAELAMRRGDGTEGVAIAAYLRAADSDPRSHRYQGWQLRSEGRNTEAAAELAKAGSKREQARALLAANDIRAALGALDGGGGGSPEGLVIEARGALADKQVAVARAKIDQAELEAPANPVVHGAVLELVQQAPDEARAKISRLVVELGTALKDVTSEPGATEIQLGDGSGARTVALDQASKIDIDARPLEPLVKLLPGLTKLEQAKITLVEQRIEPSLFSFRVAQPRAVRDGLTKILQSPPYALRVGTSASALPDGGIDRAALASHIGDGDAVLVYRVEPAGGLANVRLTLHLKGTNVAANVDRDVDMPAAVGWNKVKIWVVSIAGTIVVLMIVLWLTRAMGKVKIDIERSADITDDAFCVLLSKQPERPAVDNEAELFEQTKQAGAIAKPRFATLFANGHVFKVPAGKWFVHLYGVYVRGGKYRKVPETFTQSVELRRGDFKPVEFDLSSKLAEVRVVIESEPKSGHSVWANDDDAKPLVTDEAGEAVLMLPIGAHTIHIEAMGHRMKKQIQIAAIKIERLPFNVARELRIAGDADLAHGDAPSSVIQPLSHGDLDLDAPPPQADPVSGVKIRTGPKVASGAAAERTLPVGEATSAAMRAPAARAASRGDMLLDRYRIVAELGRGAMGVVRRAWDEKLEREVAIKEMAEDLRSNPEAMRLFTQEAKALAQLNHTNIVAMYDQITETDRVYMIMEYVDGQPLEALLAERERLPWLEAIGLVDQVLAGLAYAHARKVIHRDIKPANIFVAKDGVVKIGDFGLARVLREVTIRKTEIRGTPLYMAPEQITGTDVDHRADLYAVGCTLFELVTGRPPHVEGDILYAQLHSPAPAPSTLVSDLPASFDVLIAKLIAKQAEERFASASDVRAALRKLA